MVQKMSTKVYWLIIILEYQHSRNHNLLRGAHEFLSIHSNNSNLYFQIFSQYRITIQRGCSIINAILNEHVAFIFRVEWGKLGMQLIL